MMFRTFDDLLASPERFSVGGSTCRFCRSYSKPTRYYSVRHVVCFDCATERKGQVLPAALKAEAKARALVKRYPDPLSASFVATISRAPLAYVQSLYAVSEP